MQSNTTRHAKKQEYMTCNEEKNKTDLELTQMLKLTYKGTKSYFLTCIHMFQNLSRETADIKKPKLNFWS